MMKSTLIAGVRYGAAMLLGLNVVLASVAVQAETLARQVDGLWSYTGLATSTGTEMPLTGIFLFKDGVFLQQSIFDSEPFSAAGAMAHAGPYSADADLVYLSAEQTISIGPDREQPHSFRANTSHELAVDRRGAQLTLVFSAGTGTVQTFERVGDGVGEVYWLQDGAFALVDGHFILVQGAEQGSVTGYGRYQRERDVLTLQIIRWSEASAEGDASNLRDLTMSVRFDGDSLVLEDGRSFAVIER